MVSNYKPVTRVVGVSDRRMMPRKGVIRLGVKKKSKGGAEYPAEVDYFVVDKLPEVVAVYGKEPKELNVMLPTESQDVNFPQAFKYYGKSKGLKCSGNGVEGQKRNDETGEWESCQCPCPLAEETENSKKPGEKSPPKCSVKAHLYVILPDISVGGVYQITTGSKRSVQNINSYMSWLRGEGEEGTGLIGRCSWVMLKLKRVPTEMVWQGQKREHYCLELEYEGTQDEAIKMRGENQQFLSRPAPQLPPPDDTNPSFDGEGEVLPPDYTDEEATDNSPEDFEKINADAAKIEAELVNDFGVDVTDINEYRNKICPNESLQELTKYVGLIGKRLSDKKVEKDGAKKGKK